MRTTIISILLLSVNVVYGQLNFEGNPLTEDTEYTAEESNVAEKTAKARSLDIPETEDSYLLAAKILQAERAQSLKKSSDYGQKNRVSLSSNNGIFSAENSSPATNSYRTIPDDALDNPVEKNVPGSEIQYQDQTYPENTAETSRISDRSEIALMTFLNSKSPEESKTALEAYLAGQETAHTTNNSPEIYPQPHISEILLPQGELVNVEQQLKQIGQSQERHTQYADTEYPDSETRVMGSSDYRMPLLANRQAGRNIMYPNHVANVPTKTGPVVLRGPPPFYGRRNFVVRPPYPGKTYRAQSRVGPPPGVYKGSHFSSGSPEIIYTKPPGYGNIHFSKTPNPYEDASAWFPDADYPPPDMNVYHSQLYAQSYDPNYYNYIAKYGKIKPHLYGKFDKHEEGIFSELFRNFKKHGMKHVMHPMFLLGLGIPMVTLMLSALIHKRSLARSGARGNNDHVSVEELDEWITKLQKALDCYSGSTAQTEREKCTVFD